jgi:hypothetical protein
MSERETKEIKTPVDNHVLIIKTYLTGREYREIEAVFLSMSKISPDGSQVTEMNGSVVKQAEDKLIEQAVVSVDGSTEKMLDTILDFKRNDFNFVITELNTMRYGEIDGKKKLPS